MPSPAPEPATVRTVRRGEVKALRLSGALSSLEVALQGAHVLDWALPGTPPVLFMSPLAVFQPGKTIRGGVPLIFPWFGTKADDAAAPQHGFVRARLWALKGASVVPGGECSVSLGCSDDEATRAAWPHAFSATFSASAGAQLQMDLAIRNRGSAAFTFEAALHTYFAVSDVRQTSVGGLAGAQFIDKVAGGERKHDSNPRIAFDGETDRVYLDTEATCTIDDPGWKRRIVIAKSGSRSTVVWNPGPARGRAMADVGEDAWQGFVCVETAIAADDARTLAPGETHTLQAIISVEQEQG